MAVAIPHEVREASFDPYSSEGPAFSVIFRCLVLLFEQSLPQAFVDTSRLIVKSQFLPHTLVVFDCDPLVSGRSVEYTAIPQISISYRS
jgi:hypothetical protein